MAMQDIDMPRSANGAPGKSEPPGMLTPVAEDYEQFIPREIAPLPNPQTDIPRIAKDKRLMAEIESAIRQIPSAHRLIQADARKLEFISDESVHLVITSPPYRTLKKYRDNPAQLGEIAEYEAFLGELDRVWRQCHRVLVPGGRLVCGGRRVPVAAEERWTAHGGAPPCFHPGALSSDWF